MSQLIVKQYTTEDEYHESLTFTTGVDQGLMILFKVYEDGTVDGEIISSNVGDNFEELAEVLRGLADTLDKGELND